jgi:hypothetical protein
MHHGSFDDIRASATASVPVAGALEEGDAEPFVPKGTNGRLREELSLEHSVAHECGAIAEPSQECAGRLLTGDLR